MGVRSTRGWAMRGGMAAWRTATGLTWTAVGAAYREVMEVEELKASPTHAPAETAKRPAAAKRVVLSLECWLYTRDTR